jgi:hypothetical protein
MHQVTIDIPDETLLALKLAPAGAAQELRLAAAVKLYELGRLSYGVPTFRLTEEELRREMENA